MWRWASAYLLGIGTLAGASADALAAGPEARATLVLAAEPGCSTAAQREVLLDALRVRLPAFAIVVGDGDAQALRWATSDAPGSGPGVCTLSFMTVDGLVELPADPSASDDDLRAAAVRIAWWVELRRRRAALDEVPGKPRPAPAPPSVLIGLGFGASDYPTPGEPAGALRLQLMGVVGERIALGVELRLVTEVGLDSAFDVDVYDRSIGLVARYDLPLAPDLAFGVGLGARWALPEVDTDELQHAEIARPASNLAVASSLGLGWRVADDLRVRADGGVAVSVGSRRVRGRPLGGGSFVAAGELGVVAVELVVGLEIGL